MSTLQNTISILKVLPESDLIKVQDFAKKLSKHRESDSVDEAVGKFLRPLSREDFLKDIEISEQQFAAGEYQEMGEAINDICQELNI